MTSTSRLNLPKLVACLFCACVQNALLAVVESVVKLRSSSVKKARALEPEEFDRYLLVDEVLPCGELDRQVLQDKVICCIAVSGGMQL